MGHRRERRGSWRKGRMGQGPGKRTKDSRCCNSGEDNEVTLSGVAVGEPMHERRQRIRQAARAAFLEADDEERLRRASAHQTRPTAAALSMGHLVYVWRKGVGDVKPHWHGPGHDAGSAGFSSLGSSGCKDVQVCTRTS